MHHRLRNALIVSLLLCLGSFTSYGIEAQPVQPILILSPGDHSLVTAPILISAQVHAGDDGLVRVSLVDKQQNLLARQVLRINARDHHAVEFETELLFEIPAESTTAVLTVATQDHANRPVTVRSVPLTLQSGGEDRIELKFYTDPWLTVSQPEPGAMISNSPLIVVGTVTPINDYPVIFELVTERGSVIVTRQLGVESLGEEIDFEISLPYLPSLNIRDMRLVIRQTSGITGVSAILDSLPLTITP